MYFFDLVCQRTRQFGDIRVSLLKETGNFGIFLDEFDSRPASRIFYCYTAQGFYELSYTLLYFLTIVYFVRKFFVFSSIDYFLCQFLDTFSLDCHSCDDRHAQDFLKLFSVD